MCAINYIYHITNKKYRRPGLESLVSSYRSKTDRTHDTVWPKNCGTLQSLMPNTRNNTRNNSCQAVIPRGGIQSVFKNKRAGNIPRFLRLLDCYRGFTTCAVWVWRWPGTVLLWLLCRLACVIGIIVRFKYNLILPWICLWWTAGVFFTVQTVNIGQYKPQTDSRGIRSSWRNCHTRHGNRTRTQVI